MITNHLESKRTKKSLLDLKAIQMCLFSILIFFRRSDGYLSWCNRKTLSTTIAIDILPSNVSKCSFTAINKNFSQNGLRRIKVRKVLIDKGRSWPEMNITPSADHFDISSSNSEKNFLFIM